MAWGRASGRAKSKCPRTYKYVLLSLGVEHPSPAEESRRRLNGLAFLKQGQ